MQDIARAMEEIAEETEAHPLPKPGEIGGGHTRVDNVKPAVGGNQADYLARRMARDRPDILAKLKAGDYQVVDLVVVREWKRQGMWPLCSLGHACFNRHPRRLLPEAVSRGQGLRSCGQPWLRLPHVL